MNDEARTRTRTERRYEAPPPRVAEPMATTTVDTEIATIQGSTRDVDEANRRLALAASKWHLISPATVVGDLPEGTTLVLSVVHVDPRPLSAGGDVYSTGGFGDDARYALGRSALQRISAAAGISWDPRESRRVDDGSSPRYCYFQAVGTYRDFDGAQLTLSAHREMDLRDGSDQVNTLIEEHAEKVRKYRAGQLKREPAPIAAQLRGLRHHIASHAETKAMLRAVRSLGLKNTYSAEELTRPFVVAKIMWTGRSDDPELRRRFAELTAAKFLGGSGALYGSMNAPAAHVPTTPPVQAPPPPPTPKPFSPPPVGKSAVDEGLAPTPRGAKPPAAGQRVAPFGSAKGVPLSELEDEELTWLIRALRRDVGDPAKERWRAKNLDELSHMLAEEARRHGPPATRSPRDPLAGFVDEQPWDDDGL